MPTALRRQEAVHERRGRDVRGLLLEASWCTLQAGKAARLPWMRSHAWTSSRLLRRNKDRDRVGAYIFPHRERGGAPDRSVDALKTGPEWEGARGRGLCMHAPVSRPPQIIGARRPPLQRRYSTTCFQARVSSVCEGACANYRFLSSTDQSGLARSHKP